MFQMNSVILINEISMLTVEVVIYILLFAYQKEKDQWMKEITLTFE